MVRALDLGAPHRRQRIVAATKLGGAGHGGLGLGFEGERGPASTEDRASERIRARGRTSVARLPKMAGTWHEVDRRRRRVRCGAEQNRGGREGG